MDLLMDGLLMAATLFAGIYCWVLARRVEALKSLDQGLGGAIVTLTRQIELARTTLDEARARRATAVGARPARRPGRGAAGQLSCCSPRHRSRAAAGARRRAGSPAPPRHTRRRRDPRHPHRARAGAGQRRRRRPRCAGRDAARAAAAASGRACRSRGRCAPVETRCAGAEPRRRASAAARTRSSTRWRHRRRRALNHGRRPSRRWAASASSSCASSLRPALRLGDDGLALAEELGAMARPPATPRPARTAPHCWRRFTSARPQLDADQAKLNDRAQTPERRRGEAERAARRLRQGAEATSGNPGDGRQGRREGHRPHDHGL